MSGIPHDRAADKAAPSSRGRSMDRAAWHNALAALGIAAAAILVIFQADIIKMVDVWWTASTYGHCFLIAPIIGWLVWQRRARSLLGSIPIGWWPGADRSSRLAGLGWLMGEAGSVSFARQFGIVIMLQGAGDRGPGAHGRRARADIPVCSTPFSSCPFGESLEAPLAAGHRRRSSCRCSIWPAYPATSNGVLIHAGRYYFEVAEACSGTKFVIAMLAFGILVCNVCFCVMAVGVRCSWRSR